MRRSKGTGCITAMKDGRYKYRGLIRIGVNKNGNPKNKVFYGNTKKEVEEKLRKAKEQKENEENKMLAEIVTGRLGEMDAKKMDDLKVILDMYMSDQDEERATEKER